MFVSRLKTAQRGWRCAVQMAVLLVVALVPLTPAGVEAATDTTFPGRSLAAFVPEQSAQTHGAAGRVSSDASTTSPRPAPMAVTQTPGATTTFTGTTSAYSLSTEIVDRLPPLQARSDHTATLLADGKVLVVGGKIDDEVLASAELYDPASGTWTTTGSLGRARSHHTATLLPNGKVLVAGGGGALGSAEVYDPASGTWTATGGLTQRRWGHTATRLADGKVLVAGGYNNGFLATVEVYDPASGTWTTTGSLSQKRNSHTATLLPNGKVLVAGGKGYVNDGAIASAELYDPASGTWTTTGSLSQRRYRHTATLLPNGKVLVAGGNLSGPLASAEVYDPASGTWTTTGRLAAGRSHHAATLLADGKVLVAGGSRALGSAEVYDPASGTWAATGRLGISRAAHTATLLADGKVLVAGGYYDGTGPTVLGTAEVYDPARGTWTVTGSLPPERAGHTATRLVDGKVLVVGGRSGWVPVTAEVYDPAGGTWTATSNLTAARSGHTATLLPNGKVLVVGGSNADVYDPASGTWTATGNPTEERYSHTATLLPNGKVLVVGGKNVRNVATAEVYDPATGTWTVTGSLRPGRYGHTATRLADGRVLVVGGYGDAGTALASTEVYDPASGTWTTWLATRRSGHTATLLDDGRVLVAGGYDNGSLANAGVYDPASGNWTATSNLTVARSGHTATLLPNGKVLVVGGTYYGTPIATAEVYDPATGTWTSAGRLRKERSGHTATLLEDGKVLFFGGANAPLAELGGLEIVNTFSGTLAVPAGWTSTRTITFKGSTTGAPLSDGAVNNGPWVPAQPNVATTATLPATPDGAARPVVLRLRDTKGRSVGVVVGQINLDTAPPTSAMSRLASLSQPEIVLRWSGSDTLSGVTAYDVEVRDGDAGTWTSLLANTTQRSTTFTGVREHTYYFRVRAHDGAGNVEAWSAEADTMTTVDPNAPTSAMTMLPTTSPPSFRIGWSGSDALSGVAVYDVEVRDGSAGAWTSLLANTTARSTTFAGVAGHRYFFRVRAHDGAGNVEAWPATYDTFTEVDTVAPVISSLTLNGGARATTMESLTVRVRATDTQSTITEMRVRINGAWQTWRPFAPTFSLDLPGADGTKEVAVMVRDVVRNASEVVTQTIRLDSAAGTDYEMTINDGALWTNTPTVTLRIGAPGGASAMRVSNDGGFSGAPWQAFDTRPSWTISTFGNYTIPRTVYVRVRDANGTNLTVVTDDIIYDPLPPTGSVTVTAASATAFTVRLSAVDQAQLSGVSQMRLSTNPRFTGAVWRTYATSATVTRDGTATRVYAQFRDRAGNVSRVVSAVPR